MQESAEHYELVVIGSGPGGRRAAIQGAKFGKRVLIVEQNGSVGGVSVHTGTIPSKTLRETVLHLSGAREREFYGMSYRAKADITADDILQRLNTTLRHEIDVQASQYHRNNVDICYGRAHLLGPHELEVLDGTARAPHFTFEKLIVAVGTVPFRPDYIPFDHKRVIDSDELLSLERLPTSLTVIGAGVIGLEYATIFSALSVNVNLVDPRESVLDFADKEIIDDLLHQMKVRGVNLRLGYSVESIESLPDSERLVCHLSGGRQLVSDMVLFAAGRMGATEKLGLENCGLEVDHRGRLLVNDHYQTQVSHIYAVGDVIGFPSLASTSMEQGRYAACHMFGRDDMTMNSLFPYGIYAVPEVSMVGMTEQEANQADIPYEIGIARFRETARGQIMGLKEGMMKCIFALADQRLLGVHIVGEGATELVHIGQAVIAHNGTLSYFLDNTFNYPTLAEAYKVAALDAWNRMPRPQAASTGSEDAGDDDNDDEATFGFAA